MTEWISQRLTAQHDLSSFNSGQDSLDEWLRSTSLRAHEADATRTYVWTGGDEKVVAYYSVAPTEVRRESVSRGASGGFNVVPAYLLARLALDRSLQGQGLGSQLLIDALEKIVDASVHGGGRLVVVDAIDDAAVAFYRHHDFRPVKGDDKRLFMKVSTARNALGLVSASVASSQDAPLVSLTFELPDGTPVPMVLSPAEARLVGERLHAAIDQASGTSEEAINIAAVLQDALGHSPFESRQ